jgi:RNA polymerase sigma-70 factor (ECF subfamily)
VADRSGDVASFEAFFERAAPSLVAMAYTLTGDHAAAQDLAQEALIRTWGRWATVGQFDRPLGWSRRVLYHLAVSGSRSDAVRRRPVRGPTSSPPPDEDHVALARALRTLPEHQARAVVLHDGAGVPVRDIAEELGVPEGTVTSWLHRGRAAAAAQLDPYPSEEGHVRR